MAITQEWAKNLKVEPKESKPKKEATARTFQSTSETSSEEPLEVEEVGTETLEAVIPQTKRRGRPPGSKNKTTTKEGILNKVFAGENLRQLPADEKGQEEALAPFRMYARMCISAHSKVAKLMGVEGPDSEETESGVNAHALMLYQTGITVLDWRFAMGMWCATYYGPRIAEMVEKRAKKGPKPVGPVLRVAQSPGKEEKEVTGERIQ